jgi:subtilase family serine protease
MTRLGKRSAHSRWARRKARIAVEQLEARNLLAYTPAQIAHAYGFDLVKFSNGTIKGDGSGQTIAIVDAFDDPTIASDLQKFDSTFGLPAPPSFQKLTPQGQPAANAGWALEIALDVEWAHAIAPGANIVLVEAANNSSTNLYAADVYAANLPGVSVVSNSWGSGEYSGETSADANFTHAGVTFIFSAGDSGAGTLYASASPNVLSIGGTTLNLDGSGNWLGETAWSGSGGGPSVFEAKPSYQSGVTISSTRATPDVAFDANPSTGVYVYDTNNGGWFQVGGTSLGSPAWAGLVAIVNQGRAVNGNSSLNGSDLLAQIYKVSANDFHDITSGSNGYQAGPGYDFVTGRGSPIANLLIPDLVATGTGSTQPPTVPSAPTGLSATAGDGQVTLTWNGSSGATSYNVYRSLTKGGEGATAYKKGITSTSFTDTGLTDGTTYYYTVTAVNSAGESGQSSEVSATPQKSSTVVAIDSGGGAAGSFVSDTDYSGGHRYSTFHSIDTSRVTNPAPQSVYQTERWGNFTYTVPNLTPGASYTIRLHFAEIYWNSAGARLFNVNINGTQVLTNFDIFASAGGKYIAIVKQFTATADANGQITIQFISLVDNAKLSGLEIIAASGSAIIGNHASGVSIRPPGSDSSPGVGFGSELPNFLVVESPHAARTDTKVDGNSGGTPAASNLPALLPSIATEVVFAAAGGETQASEPDWTEDLLMQSEI